MKMFKITYLPLLATLIAFSASINQVFAGNFGTIKAETGYATDLGSIVTFALNFIMVLALLLVFFYLIWGGIQWITSGGDKSKTEEARNKITAAVVGIIILAAAYALVQFVAMILGFGGLNEAIRGINPLNSSGGAAAPTGGGSGGTGTGAGG